MDSVTQDEKGNIIDSKSGAILIPAKKPLETLENQGISQTNTNAQAGVENTNPSLQTAVLAKPKVYSKYEVKPDAFFDIKFGIIKVEDRWTVITEQDAEITKGAEKHWVKFRMWNFSEELSWKSQSMEYDQVKRSNILSQDKLTELKLRNLLLDWSFSESENSLKLLHVNKLLSDEGVKIFYSLYPSIIRYIITRMNDVLEYNS